MVRDGSNLAARDDTLGNEDNGVDRDKSLVLAAQDDLQSFGVIYEKYVDAIYRYCFRRTGLRESAEDATAMVFMKAMASLKNFHPDGRSFRSWLFAIAHNTLVDAARRQNNANLSGEFHMLADDAPGPESNVLEREDAREIESILAVLPIDQRRVLELRLAGLRTPEIAEALGISGGAVRASQYRAAKRLRMILGTEMDGNSHGE